MATPIRGTQSFVGIMGQVWRRPSLTALEIAWRGVAAAIVLFIAAPIVLGSLGMDIHLTRSTTPITPPNFSSLQSITVFQPVIAAQTIQATFVPFFSAASPLLRWILPSAILAWLLIAAFGRTIVLRRLDPALHARRLTLFLLGTLRALLLLGAWTLWLRGLSYAARTAITAPAARGDEPSLVLFAAMLICGTLLLYVLWAIFSWFLQLAPLLAMQRNLGPIAALRAALTSPRELRGKLIEINLVMHIVRIALIVLAMVFSASPLPFSSVETQTFLTCWWIGVGLLYLAMSDYFHVVRAAAYLSLHRALTQGSSTHNS
jgi:hypothetical protein